MSGKRDKSKKTQKQETAGGVELRFTDSPMNQFYDQISGVRDHYRDASPDQDAFNFRFELEVIQDVLREALGQVSLRLALLKAEQAALQKLAYDDKKELAKQMNQACREAGLAIAHPDSGEPCILLAISDVWGGKFTLENCKTKKRSKTSREIGAMLPFKLVDVSGNKSIAADGSEAESSGD